ncbi:MAG: copper homeostasis membrane protein CopD [Rhizobiales bacterium]|nr:copper homeostasis membrane protein CopD [Hyphomicrobiales bacterium]
MIEAGLLVARLLHYAAVTSLAGLTFFPLYACMETEPLALSRWRRKWSFWTAVAALVSGLFWFAFVVASMGDGIGDLVDPETLRAIVDGTSFGKVWSLRMLVALAVVGMAASSVRWDAVADHRAWTMPVLAAVLLASLAGTGHARVEEGWAGAIHTISDGAHLLAAGAWLGGLIPLAAILRRSGAAGLVVEPRQVGQILLRFSGMGYIAVATLIGSGLVNSWFLVGPPAGLLTTSYGQFLLGKLVLFGVMLALAGANRFWLVPSMNKARIDAPDEWSRWSARLRNHVLGEQVLGWMVLAVVSFLGTMQPAIGQ